MSPEQPPGWYADASMPGFERWWDGGAWSHVTRPSPSAPQPPAPPGGATGGWGAPTAPGAPGAPGDYRGAPGYEQPPAPGPAQPYGSPPPYPAPYPAGYAYPQPRGMTADGRALAGRGWRLLARWIDGVILLVVASILGWSQLRAAWTAMRDYLDTLPNGQLPPDFAQQVRDNQAIMVPIGVFGFVYWAVSALYFVLLTRLRGATLGKMMVGIRVRPLAADRLPSWGQAVLRWASTDLPGLIPTVGGLYVLLDSLWCTWDGKRQCLHDKLPKTVVIRGRDRPGDHPGGPAGLR